MNLLQFWNAFPRSFERLYGFLSLSAARSITAPSPTSSTRKRQRRTREQLNARSAFQQATGREQVLIKKAAVRRLDPIQLARVQNVKACGVRRHTCTLAQRSGRFHMLPIAPSYHFETRLTRRGKQQRKTTSAQTRLPRIRQFWEI